MKNFRILKSISVYFISCLIISDLNGFKGDENHFVIITCSYNNRNFCEWNLKTIFAQNYDNYELVYIDDCSSDGTFDAVSKIVNNSGKKDKVKLIHNDRRRLALENLYEAFHKCNDNDIIVILDGDDGFAHNGVLSYLNNIYKDKKIWLTYGQYIEKNSGNKGFNCAMPQHIVNHNAFRKWQSGASHLRTFKAWLAKKIKIKDLMINGQFFPMTYDLAIMFPMLEMASKGHFRFITDILYIYNDSNPISDHNKDKQLQRSLDLYIRGLKPYKPL